MMRTLAITVFAMSLTLIGCGSSSTSKKDGATDATPDVINIKTDVAPSPDTIKDTGVPGDTKVSDSAIETDDAQPRLDVAGGDTRTSDTAQPDAFVRLDVSVNTDTPVVPVVDAPVASDTLSSDAGSDVGGDAQVD